MRQKHDIFISYRREGGIDSAVTLRSTLRQMHYRVFLDVDNLRTGHFDTELLRRIEECRDFLLVLSPGALDRCMNEDDWVRREIEHAMALGKNIIPIICDGGSVQERLQVPLPPSLADLPRYNVLETNLVQLRAMTQLLRTSLTSRPHNPMKGVALGAAAAVVLCVSGFFAAGQIADRQSVYPRTDKEITQVGRAVTQQTLNLGTYNAAQGDYLAALDACKLYLSGSPQMTRGSLSLQMDHALTAISGLKGQVKEIDAALLASITDPRLPAEELETQDDYLHTLLDEMIGNLLYLEYTLIDDDFTPSASKLLWVDHMKEMADLDADTAMLGLNDAFLAVTEEKTLVALIKARSELNHLYDQHPWYATETELEAASDAIFKDQQKALDKLYTDVLQGEAMLAHEQNLRALQQRVREEQLAALRAELEELRQQLAAEKATLYQTHKPLRSDGADILFAKGLMFLSFDMTDASLESFTLYGMSDDPNAKAVAESVSRFALNRELTGVRSGLVITMYESDKPEQPVQIGDIVYAVNGTDVVYFDDYVAAKNGNPASTLYLLRFTDAGYELLTVQLDPSAGLLGLRSLAYK